MKYDILKEIEKLCGNRSLEGFIGSCETRLADYSGKYQTQNDLADKIRKNEADLDQVNSDLKKCDSIPAEYESVDPDEYVNNLDNEIKHYKDLLEGELKTNREQAYGRLANRSSEDFDDALEDAKRKLEEKKEEYSHWKHISEVFTKLKEGSNCISADA